MKRNGVVIALFLSAIIISGGCLSWDEGWKQEYKASKKGNIEEMLKTAADLENKADTRERILEVIKSYESVLEVDPANYTALSNLGSLTFLIAYGHSDDADQKEQYYLKAIKYCERGMYTNEKFKKRIDQGEKTWKACYSLSEKEMRAMYFWYLGTGNYWLECQNAPKRLVTFYWSGRFREMLKAMTKIAPEWDMATPVFAWGSFYAAAPGFAGGDLQKAKEYFDRAIKKGPAKVNFRTTRARYLHAKNKDREAFKRDLEWAIKQDPKKNPDPYPWAVYHRNQAKEMLKNIDAYF